MEVNEKKPFRIVAEIPVDTIRDALCSAFDPVSNGVGYWCEISGNRPPHGKIGEENVYPYMDYPVYEGGALFLKDIESEDGETYELSRDTIRHGLEIMATSEEGARHYADLIAETGDKTTGDVLVQYALFGEIRYS